MPLLLLSAARTFIMTSKRGHLRTPDVRTCKDEGGKFFSAGMGHCLLLFCPFLPPLLVPVLKLVVDVFQNREIEAGKFARQNLEAIDARTRDVRHCVDRRRNRTDRARELGGCETSRQSLNCLAVNQPAEAWNFISRTRTELDFSNWRSVSGKSLRTPS